MAVFAFLSAIAAVLAGCGKNERAPLDPAQIHSITQQLAAAAASAAPPKSVIKIRHAPASQQPKDMDELYIGLENGVSTESTRAEFSKLIQSLDSVATRNHLTQDPPVQSGALFVLTLRRSGVATHRIEITTNAATPESVAKTHNGKTGEARLAIILDDLGTDRAAAEAIFALRYPLTISVLPNHEHSIDIAEEAHRRGYQVMLHLPMQSVGNEKPESQELRPGMPEQEVAAVVDQFLRNVPGVIGVNNHQGSQATADSALMAELMPVLREHHLFYVDSRTTAATVAFDTAQRDGVRSGFRNVPFLDDVAEVAAVRKQLDLALRGAREKGEAIAIGHPHPATLQALREVLPRAEAQGVQLVFASELVH
jgi:polysaccharide deacetylase 2 family uncharacterized protein YibQ